MAPRGRTRQELIDLLGRAAEQARHAETYHLAAANPGAVKGREARQAACDAAAMQLIELAGCADEFICGRGDPGTTLARLDDALEPVVHMRLAHTHPERVFAPPPITRIRFGHLMGELKKALENLDSETLRIQRQDQREAITGIYHGLDRIERDGLPNAAALRGRDLHYAGYYHEIQFGRLAKATRLFESWNSPDARRVDVNSSIFDTDDLAHKFHTMRGGADKSILPVSVVAPEHRNRVPGRLLSELMRELRDEHQTAEERLAELAMGAKARARQERRDGVKGLAQTYVGITGDKTAGIKIHEYLQKQGARLDRDAIDGMRQALDMAARSPAQYQALPETMRDHCVRMSLALDEQGDSRLLDILDAADRRDELGDRKTTYDEFPGLKLDDGEERDLGLGPDFDEERGPRRER